MAKNLGDLRESYQKNRLDLLTVSPDPIQQFVRWFHEALKSKLYEPNAMTLATVRSDGQPAARMVLLKGIEEGRFIFYTNYQSEKGQELNNNPRAALLFWWPELERQVRVEGQVEQVPGQVSDAYFASRPRGSQLAARVSKQSEKLNEPSQLQEEWMLLRRQLKGKKVSRPSHWGGYQLKPQRIEFWQGQPNRLHQRLRYSPKSDLKWSRELLYP
jgi:pyridoxamine 5'-phosphate oxidase